MPTIKTIQANTNLSDIALQQYSTVEALFAIALQNNAGITDDVIAGNTIALPPYKPPVQILPNTQPQLNVAVTKNVKPIPLQTLVDIAMQETGTIDNIFTLANLNNIAITTDLEAGADLLTPLPMYEMKDIVVVLQQKKPASGLTINQTNILLPGGVGYMQIQNNFIIS